MTVLNLQVSASSDDAFENASGTMTLNGTSIVFNNAGYWCGFRFLNVTIPQGATINSANFQFYITSTTRDDNEQDVYCQDADDAATFSSSSSDISSRPLTTAKTNATANSVGTGFYAIDITAAVQEVIDRAGWVNGNDLAVIMDALTGVNLGIDTYDNVAANAAKLDIDYSAGLSATVNQATETDTAQPVARLKTLAVAQATETDSSQAINARKTLAIGQAAETDTAQAISIGAAVVAVGQSSETDTALAITARKTAVVGQSSEVDTAVSITSLKTLAVGQAGEADSSQAIAPMKVRAIGQAAEIDAVQAITSIKRLAISQVSETDLAQAITAVVGTLNFGSTVELSDYVLWAVVLSDLALYSVGLGDSALYGVSLQDNER